MSTSPVVHFLTLGCPKNEADTRRMCELVARGGYSLTDDPEDADIAVVNTCSFIEAATEESIQAILELAQDWKNGALGRRLVVTGCMPSRYTDQLAAELPEVDAFLSVENETTLLDTLATLTGITPVHTDARPGPVGPFAYLTVSDGCDRTCSYCTIPSIRGSFRSIPPTDVEIDARKLLGAGAKELVLVGQDVSSYGRGGDDTLASLVRRLSILDGLDWLRLMYLQPEGVTDDLLETMALSSPVCHYLDVPLQHASHSVLRRMGRAGDDQAYLALIARIRDALPDVVLRTTLIAGFPGETEEDLSILQDFLTEALIDHVGIFVYSPEEGTPAASMPDQIPLELARERANALRDTADGIAFLRFSRLVGSTLDVLVEGPSTEGTAVGRWRGQAPEVDGVVYLERSDVRPGDLVRATVEESVAYDLIARTVV